MTTTSAIKFGEFMSGSYKFQDQFEKEVKSRYNKKEIKSLKKMSVWLWSVAGTMMAQTPAFAADSGNLWIEMKPIFGLFQEIGMVLGAFAIIGGLIIMIFKKKVAVRIIGVAAIAVGGVFLVPSAIMLIAIIGSMMNDALTAVFSGLDIGGSVKVGQ
jgi:hypothetical protein